MATVQTFPLGLDDVIIVKIPVGQMPHNRVVEFLEDSKQKMQEVFGGHNKMLMLPSRGDKAEIEITFVKRTP